jgi:xylan 1,4-beta-xylosidase
MAREKDMEMADRWQAAGWMAAACLAGSAGWAAAATAGAGGGVAVTGTGAASAPAAATFQWSNPIHFQGGTARDEVRDPCIIREGDTYYLVFTMFPFRGRDEKHLGDADQGSSPGIKLLSSTDLKTWREDGWMVKSSQLPEDCPYKHRFWAPEIHKMGGKFYLVFTADNWIKNEYNPAGRWGTAGYAFVGVADRITGPYEHITYIDGGACDTSLFEDTDGKTYAVIPAGDIFLQPIDLSGLPQGKVKLLGKRQRIVTADNADIAMPARPDYLEGPWLLRIAGRYCVLFAGPWQKAKFPDHAGYWAGAAWADSLAGPWRKDPRGQVFLGGHLAVFPGPDGRNWFSYRGEKLPKTRGFLCIDPFDVAADGAIQCHGPSVGELSVPLKVQR